jgi:hypothetical protein
LAVPLAAAVAEWAARLPVMAAPQQ